MSKNRNYRNYYNQNKPNENPVQNKPVVDEVATAVATAVAESEEESSVVVPVGVVSNCQRLNVRMYPRTESKVLCVIDCDAKVTIDTESSTDTFYKVSTVDGIEGFCMKKYITLL